ncbi:MAG: DUF1494 domain-containing protein [Chlamydiales bacterium]
MRRRQPITLLEVVISLGLLTFLLTTLFFWYSRLMTQKKAYEQIKWPLLEERYAEQRLASLFPKIKTPFFTTHNGNLVFLFDRGIYSDPSLSNTVLGHLYHDSTYNRLCLGVWPAPEKEKPLLKSPCQTFILLDKVSSLSFEFYPSKFEDDFSMRWQTAWLAENQTLPSMIKVKIERERIGTLENRSLVYYLDFPQPIEVEAA